MESSDIQVEGQVLQILEPADAGWTFHVENLEEILLQPDIQDRHLAVVSVVGKFRTGKSFLTSVLLNHLQRAGQTANWLYENELHLDGFEWKISVDRVTAGIMMWSKAFPIDLPSGEKIAVLLIDTQGTFDTESSTQQSATIFALSTLMSSVQIFNVQNKLGGDDFDHLSYFTAYGALAQQQTAQHLHTQEGNDVTTPFQELHILIRDWSNRKIFDLGSDGGRKYINHVCKPGSELKKKVDSCFSSTKCFLLPHPGDNLANDASNDTLLPGMDEKFREHLAKFVSEILSPTKLLTKKIGGRPVKANAFITMIEAYTSCFNSGELPKPESLFNLNANASYYNSVDAATTYFHTEMDQTFGAGAPAVSVADFYDKTEHLRQNTIEMFEEAPKIGSCLERNDKFRLLLEDALKRISDSKFAINTGKLELEPSILLSRQEAANAQRMLDVAIANDQEQQRTGWFDLNVVQKLFRIGLVAAVALGEIVSYVNPVLRPLVTAVRPVIAALALLDSTDVQSNVE